MHMLEQFLNLRAGQVSTFVRLFKLELLVF